MRGFLKCVWRLRGIWRHNTLVRLVCLKMGNVYPHSIHRLIDFSPLKRLIITGVNRHEGYPNFFLNHLKLDHFSIKSSKIRPFLWNIWFWGPILPNPPRRASRPLTSRGTWVASLRSPSPTRRSSRWWRSWKWQISVYASWTWRFRWDLNIVMYNIYVYIHVCVCLYDI